MIEVKTWKCDGDGCEAVKGEGNGWLMLSFGGGKMMTITPFELELMTTDDLHFCGSACLLRKINQLIGRAINYPRGDREDEGLMTRRIKIPPRLWKAIDELVMAGIKLSNIAFNISQNKGHTITKQEAESMDKSRREWDNARRALSSILK